MANKYVPEIQVEFEKIDIGKQDTESVSSYTDSDDEKKSVNDIKLIPSARANYLRLDSGSSIGEEEEPAELTDEMREKIIVQAEYYFSDENLKKDGFLLKHVKRNKEGFVNLKLLASFKKMRSLCRDFRMIGEALKGSKKLVVNETGLKLRRVVPLPKELLDHVRVKHIVMTNIPSQNPSMNFITEAFEEHKDDVVSVRIIKPGKKFPNDLQSHFSRHPELREEAVAVVEFENPEVANVAIKTNFSNKYEGLKVKLLELGPKQAKQINGSANNSDASGTNDSDSNIERKSSQKSKGNSRLLEVTGNEDYPSSASDSEFSAFSSCNRRYNRSRGNSPSASPKSNRKPFDGNNNSRSNSRNGSRNPSPSISPKTSPKNQRKNNKNSTTERKQSSNSHKLSPLVNGTHKNSPNSSPEFDRRSKSRGNSFNEERRNKSRGNSFNDEKKESASEAKLSPWLQRRLMMSESLKRNSSDAIKSGLPQLEIIRQPKGPDGSIGFSNHPLKKYVLVHAY